MDPYMKIKSGVATTVPGGFTVLSYIPQIIPVLQAVSLVIAIASGVCGILWMYYQYKRTKK